MLRRIGAAVLIAGGTLGFVLCVVGIVACWIARPTLIRNLSRTCASADKVLAEVSDGLERTRASLQKAREGLALLPPPPKLPGPDRERLLLLRTLMPRLTPQIQDARQRLDLAADAAVVARSLLEGFEGMPLLQSTALDTDKLRDTAAQVHKLGDSAEKLRAVLGDSPDDRYAEAETARFEEQVTTALAKIGELADHVAPIRQAVLEVSGRLSRWLTLLATLATALLAWVAVGQISLVLHGKALW